MHLYVQVRQYEFFQNIGYATIFVQNDKINKKLIQKEIKKISKQYKLTKDKDDSSYAFVSFASDIEYDSMYNFSSSFVKALIEI